MTDLFVSRKLSAGDLPDLPDRDISMQEFKRLVMVDRQAFENAVKFTENFLNHWNPYTRLSWKEDPALINISLINEDSIQLGKTGDWIEERYLDSFLEYAESENLQVTRSVGDPAYPDFLAFIYRRFNHKFRARIHQMCYPGLITDLNFLTGVHLNYLRKDFDMVENHFYFKHPTFPETPWRMPAQVGQNSAISEYLGGMNYIFNSRIFHKPFAVTEWNFCFPSESYLEGAILTGAYSSLQDYSILCRFAWAHSLKNIFSPDRVGNFFDSAPDPLRRLSERILTCLFLRRDVRVSPDACACVLNFENPDSFADAFRTGKPDLSPMAELALSMRSGICFSNQPLPRGKHVTAFYVDDDFPENQGDNANVAHFHLSAMDDLRKKCRKNDGSISSSTDELVINPEHCNFKCITAKSEAFVLQKDQQLDGSFASVISKDGSASVFIASTDEQPLEKFNRILILHLTSCLNSNFAFESDDGLFRNAGDPPILMRCNRILLTFRAAGKVHLWACGFDGERLFEVPVMPGKEPGSCTVELNNNENGTPVAVYELLSESES